MTFRNETFVKKGRKAHRCSYCGGTIPQGASSNKVSGFFDGHFYAERGHSDCANMWNDAYSTHANPWEGMDFDLLEVFESSVGPTELEREFNRWRGYFPHVVCRLEYRVQRGHLAYADRCRAAGFEPTLKPHQEIYA